MAMITFACPKGHRINAPDHFAGKVANCPKCNTKFRVPMHKKEPPTDPSNLIIFFCRNGHKLNAPPRMAGERGQCPECGVKFTIPPYTGAADSDEVDLHEDEEDVLEDLDVSLDDEEYADEDLYVLDDEGALDVEYGSSVMESLDLPDDTEMTGESGAREVEDRVDVKQILKTDQKREKQEAAVHPVSAAFSKLWKQKRRGDVFELHLTAGEKLVPHYYAEELSRGGLGVFAVKEEDGTHTMLAISWDALQQVTMQKVKKLPPGVFQE